MKKKTLVYPLVTFLAILMIWEMLVSIGGIPLYILPAPSKIMKTLFENRWVLAMHGVVTLTEATIGLVIASILAFGMALIMDASQTIKFSIYPHFVVSQTIPVMILGPLFSIWLGFGMAPKIVMVILMCFFPMVVSFSDALGKVEVAQLNLLKTFGASKGQLYRLVKIPAAIGGFFSGLRVAATYCIGGAIVGEWLNASAGLGYYMIRVKNGYMLDKVFACVVVIILLSLFMNGVVKLLEKLVYLKRGKRI
ncbi:ABC transporter permease [Carnobacterium divergens]|uniref:ABC transporter permease n=1 Tax=Carnobacterium divergens TaxID=2748 RepID=UPI002890D803|nr:ABC transporter permease [Carnobacterium divergens]MDT2012373.1 ABC transporter permease [Carnobacterium divergens]